MKIREQIKDWKNIHAERVTVEKKRKKNPKMWSEKRKKNEKKKNQKKTKDNIKTFYFYFSDVWAWDWRMFFAVLFCWNCIAENFFAQFDVRGSGTIVLDDKRFYCGWIGML